MPMRPSAEARHRILFLDVDGVLNYRAIFVPGNPQPICPLAWSRLEAILAATGAQVVLSSTWRMNDHPDDPYHAKLRQIGLFRHTHPDWRTKHNLPSTGDGPLKVWPTRGDEIAEWLSRHPEIAAFAIVDDDSDLRDEQLHAFVQTSFAAGLTDAHRDRLIAILNAD